jgi:hypothetical protein
VVYQALAHPAIPQIGADRQRAEEANAAARTPLRSLTSFAPVTRALNTCAAWLKRLLAVSVRKQEQGRGPTFRLSREQRGIAFASRARTARELEAIVIAHG